ncbi:MAG: hypothetical protein E4H44_03965, partial [Candidatus Aminicenantes bacterium]
MAVEDIYAKYPNLDPKMIDAVTSAESAGNPNAVSPKGAQGLMQVMPATAAEIDTELNVDSYDLKDPETNTLFGSHYLNKMIDKFESPSLGLAAYNAGPGAVNKAIAKSKAEGGSGDFQSISKYLPEETRNYVPKVMAKYQESDSPETVTDTGTAPDTDDLGDGPAINSMAEYIKIKERQAVEGAKYSENLSNNDRNQLLDPSRPIRGALNNLHKKTPQERAQLGGVYGASVGLATGGLMGSVIGAGVGAVAARSAGIVQSEEYQVQKDNDKFIKAISLFGLVNE